MELDGEHVVTNVPNDGDVAECAIFINGIFEQRLDERPDGDGDDFDTFEEDDDGDDPEIRDLAEFID